MNNNFNESKVSNRFGSRIHLRLSLDGDYHVLDETMMYKVVMEGPYCKTARKPHVVWSKWVRDSYSDRQFGAKWNEQDTWEVFDPPFVVIVGVFDNCHLEKTLQGGERSLTKDPKLIDSEEQGDKELGMEYIVEIVSCCSNNEGEMLSCYDARDSSHTGTEVRRSEPCNNGGVSESFRQKENLQFVQCGKEFLSITRTGNVFYLNDTVENNEDGNVVKFTDVAMGDNYLSLLDSKDGDEDNELVEAFVTNENTEVSVELDTASHSTTGELERCHVVLPNNGDTEVMEADPGNNDARPENIQQKEVAE
ncbi:hypothetical protein IFM89_011614 [Coptis chinensis]|uniref:Uncharacterized protein n=1 Tax=Coptis chinensis TaxID=261450 RepID=A0A835LLT9_9MAGN|nr:hypothetical protein IFM89_011614 [Coptis chinensis]